MTYIPPATAQKIATPYGKGERHEAMIQIAMPLLGNGMAEMDVFRILRGKFDDADKTDKEIHDVIRFCVSKRPSPSVQSCNTVSRAAFAPQSVRKTPPKVVAAKFLGNSPEVEIGAAIASCDFLKLYDPSDRLNVVTEFLLDEKLGKARPFGPGTTKTVEEWLVQFRAGPVESEAGAWFRLNPCSETGSGTGGAVGDKDIVKFKFVLVESDELDTKTQLALYQKFQLPISAIVSSGANSYHAWIPVEAESHDEYKEIAVGLLKILHPFGFDQANKNPSRLCRLPGAQRKIGKVGDGFQNLLFLNTEAKPIRLDDLAIFEESLKPMPLQFSTANEALGAAIPIWDELHKNPDGTGIKTGIRKLDEFGGFKNGSLIIVGAETNVGKSVFAMNIVNHALLNNKAVALFSMEMDRVEILEILFSLRGNVDRTKFSTGKFYEDDIKIMTGLSPGFSSSKLYIFEEPEPTIEDIRFCGKRMKQEYNIDLIVVDYLQLASAPGKIQREQEVTAIGRGLRALAKETNVPVLALSQLNDDGKLRESRTLSHEAHMILKLVEDEKFPHKRKLGVTKSRRIQRGLQVDLDFVGMYSRMVES